MIVYYKTLPEKKVAEEKFDGYILNDAWLLIHCLSFCAVLLSMNNSQPFHKYWFSMHALNFSFDS